MYLSVIHGFISMAIHLFRFCIGRPEDCGWRRNPSDWCAEAEQTSGVPAASRCDSVQKLLSHDAIRLSVKTVANSIGPCEWHSITAGPLVLLSHPSFSLSLWETALSFPYEIVPSFLLAADSNMIFFFNFFFKYFLNFPPLKKKGLVSAQWGSGGRFKQLIKPDEPFRLH